MRVGFNHSPFTSWESVPLLRWQDWRWWEWACCCEHGLCAACAFPARRLVKERLRNQNGNLLHAGEAAEVGVSVQKCNIHKIADIFSNHDSEDLMQLTEPVSNSFYSEATCFRTCIRKRGWARDWALSSFPFSTVDSYRLVHTSYTKIVIAR